MAKIRLPWQKAGDGQDEGELNLPDELQQQIKAGADAAAALPKITEMLESLTRIQQEDAALKKKERDEAAAASSRKQIEEVSGTLDEQIDNLMLQGKTKEAINLANQPLVNEVLLSRFDRTKREVFEDDKEFEYYHGALKKEIDDTLEKQSLQFKSDPKFVRENIKNCYDTVVGRHHKEILEGKIKTRFAAGEGARGTSSGAAGDSGSGTKEAPKITDDIRRAARLMGFKPEEYAKMCDDEGVGYA